MLKLCYLDCIGTTLMNSEKLASHRSNYWKEMYCCLLLNVRWLFLNVFNNALDV